MSFADVAEAELLRNYVAAHEIDLIIGDPLGSLGAQGVGSPAETRDFVLLLKSLGLFSSDAFLLMHHFRKEPTNDEIDDLSGAWASHTDTILVLKMQAGNRSRLSFPKLRSPSIPRQRASSSSPTRSGSATSSPRSASSCTRSRSGARRPRSLSPGARGGIGAHRDAVTKTLEDSELFVSADGADVGRPKAAICWNLRNGQEGEIVVQQSSQGELV